MKEAMNVDNSNTIAGTRREDNHCVVTRNLWCLDEECDTPLLLPTRYASQEFWSDTSSEVLNGGMAVAHTNFSKVDCDHLPKVKQHMRSQSSGSSVGLDDRDLSIVSTKKNSTKVGEHAQPSRLPTRWLTSPCNATMDSGLKKFATVECAQPLPLPARRLTVQDNTSIEEEGPRKFAVVESGKPLRLPVRKRTTGDVDTLCCPLSASPNFATTTTDDLLPHLPHNTLARRITRAGTRQPYSCGRSSTAQDQELSQRPDTDTGNTFQCSIQTSSSGKDAIKKEKFFALKDQDRTLHRPMRQLSHDAIPKTLTEKAAAPDELGMSARFSMADFEAPLHLPLRKQTDHTRNGSVESLTDDESIDSFDQGFDIDDSFRFGCSTSVLS